MDRDTPLEKSSNLIVKYKELLQRTISGPLVASVRSERSVGSGWGSQTKHFHELIGERLTVASNDVLLWSAARPINVRYALVSSAWILLGRNDVGCLTHFNKRGAAFSHDGFTLSGAFGFRLQQAHFDQIARATELLLTDPSSRRAICFIGLPFDLLEQSRDFPCASLVQFFLRPQLECVVYMRSQSLFGVFPYDLINFRYLLRYVAWRLGVTEGRLHFVFGSLHVYQDELQRIQLFLDDEDAEFRETPALSWGSLESQFNSWLHQENGYTDLELLVKSLEFPSKGADQE